MDFNGQHADKKNTQVIHDNNVVVEITCSNGTKVRFRAGNLKITKTTNQWTRALSRHDVELELINWVQFFDPETPVPQVPPKYFACMGDAAQAYCEGLQTSTNDDPFRWEEVWKRMWEVNQQGNPNLKEEGQQPC